MASVELRGSINISIDDLGDIISEIRSVSIAALQGIIRNRADEILREFVAMDAGMRSGGSSYVPTRELADAIMITGGGTSLHIEMDGARMGMIAPSPGTWGAHMGVSGQAFNTEMPAYLNYGGGGLVSHPGSGYFEKTFGVYEAEFVHMLADALRGAGFDVSEG